MTTQRGSKFTLPARMPFEVAGTSARIEYNGLVFNDMRYQDNIKIVEISGLDDGDVRDSREINPDRDGETAFNSYYAGRQLQLRGYVVAGSYYGMKTVWGQFKQAFDDLFDLPMNFLWQDWWEDWGGDNDIWRDDYTFDTGLAISLSAVVPKVLTPLSTTEKRFVLTRRDYTDGEVTIPFTNGGGGPGTTAVGAIMRRQDASNYLRMYYQNNALKIASVSGGVETVIAGVAYTTVAQGTYYIRAYFEDGVGTAELWNGDPDVNSNSVLATVTATLPGGLGAGVAGLSGVYFLPAATSSMNLGIVKFEARNPGDTMIIGRKNGKIESVEKVDDRGRYRKDFSIPFRSATPNFVSRKPRTVTTLPTSGNIIFPADGSGLIFPADGTGIVLGVPVPDLVTNLGRSPAKPIVRFYGPCVNPGIFCTSTGKRLTTNVTLTLATQYIQFDVEAEQVTDQNGDDAYSASDASTSWMTLGRGANSLLFGADNFTPGTTKVTVTYRHTSR
jgi:hypothetical protein